MKYLHVPVMLNESIEYLRPEKGGFFVDCTLGGGGYSFEIANRVGNNGKVISFDMDDLAIDNAKRKIKNNNINNVLIIKDNFRNINKRINEIKDFKNKKFNGIVFDLGLSSAQLDDPARGISFKVDAPLNMAFGDAGDNNKKTEKILNSWKIGAIENIIKKYGEERFARRIAKGIENFRKEKKITRTSELVEIIESVVPKKYLHSKIHCATKTFQALRIATNDELSSLKDALPQAIELLEKGGRCVVISYHSLEDRIVKKYFKNESRTCICSKDALVCNCEDVQKIKLINKKVILPTEEEVEKNPRARSAKMRVVEKVS